MQILFVIAAVAGLAYFSLARRRFDLFSLAFVSACVYFLPGFFGETAHFSGLDFFDPRVPLLSETYGVMITVLGALLLAAVVRDEIRFSYTPHLRVAGTEYAAAVAVCLGLAGFGMCVVTTGADVLMDPDKNLILERLNRWHTLWATGAVLGVVLSYLRRAWFWFAISAGLLAADLYVGFRSEFAIGVITIFLLTMHDRGPQRFLLHNWRAAVIGTAAAGFLFFYKMMYVALKFGDADLLMERLSDPDSYLFAVTTSEPFYTQSILNEVIRQNFQVGIGHLSGLVYAFLPFATEFGADVVSFNEFFQPALFPAAVDTGLANNIWAQMISAGGWPLLLAFVAVFVAVLVIGSNLMRISNPEFRGGVAVLMSYWAFYIHRNDIIFQITLERGVFLLLGLILLVSMVLHAVTSVARSGHATPTPR